MERTIERILQDAGDLAGAFLWRRVCRDLSRGLRVAVVAREHGTAERLVKEVERGGIELVTLAVETDEHGNPRPSLATQDRLMGVQALLWATPITAALGTEERACLDILLDSGPSHRAVVLADADLLARMTDDPEAEAAEVRERAEHLLPDAWTLLEEADAAAWLDAARARTDELTRKRRGEVASTLLRDAVDRAAHAVVRTETDLAAIDGLLSQEDAALEAARKRGDRTAAHMLGSMRRNTEQLLVDLRDFLQSVERMLPEQVDSIDDLGVVRRTLPHWLTHVVEQWIAERLSAWRMAVLAELEEVRVDETEAGRAELLLPSLHPPPIKGDGNWPRRLGLTAALGGGAAMVMAGLWIPGLVTLSSGLLLSALTQSARDAATRDKLVTSATHALRRMGQDAERLLGEQLESWEADLRVLGEEQAAELQEERAPARAELTEQRGHVKARLTDLQRLHDELTSRIADLDLDGPDPVSATASGPSPEAP